MTSPADERWLPIETLEGCMDTRIVLWNPCDGVHTLPFTALSADIDRIKREGVFTHWRRLSGPNEDLEARQSPQLNPWQPTRRPIDLKHLGKLAEELNECGSAVARCIIQGIDEREPETGKLNRDWLEEEIADVTANIALATEHFNLDDERIFRRVKRKMDGLRTWHAMRAEGDAS
ncbi:hypothetical protein ACQR1Y_12015 [Bradyrhizobium sp. HKCCYLRH3099]|uniref:hypothetical protein n=1 Tax=unclassified Bradyrhizobium TaxID=2631580 RepID=UPI003EBBEF08